MNKRKILAVDDDPFSLTFLEEFLSEAGFDVVSARGGKEALEILLNAPNDFDCVVLDRMMPGMDGLEVFQQIRNNPLLALTPVIMQTAESALHKVEEAIAAGILYYITKPYDGITLATITRSVSEHYADARHARAELTDVATAVAVASEGVFQPRTLAEGLAVARMVGQMAVNPVVVAGLFELITNGIEHGNLGIGDALKRKLLLEGAWFDEIVDRLKEPGNAGKRATVSFRRLDNRQIEVSVKDCGEGFCWTPYMSLLPDNAFESGARGIVMARVLCFDQLDYAEGGSRVTVRFPGNPELF
jgi:CheY-like chemotaxis protein